MQRLLQTLPCWALIGLMLTACSSSEPAVPAPATVSEGSSAVVNTDGDAAQSPPDSPAPATGTNQEAATPPSAAALDPAVPPDEGPMPDLLALMRGLGWPDAEPQDVAAYVPVPPAAEGQAGLFGQGNQEVGVVLIRYPNERYAQPHVLDIQERLRLQPTFPEAIARQGRLVVHVRAVERSIADQTLSAITTRLGWAQAN